MTEEERIAIWKANEELQEEMIATRDVRIAELESKVAEMQPIVDAVSELERQVLSGIDKDIFIGITDDIPPSVHINFDWAGTLAECLIAEAWKDDLETMKAALKDVAGE